jgi:hypothetical protein
MHFEELFKIDHQLGRILAHRPAQDLWRVVQGMVALVAEERRHELEGELPEQLDNVDQVVARLARLNPERALALLHNLNPDLDLEHLDSQDPWEVALAVLKFWEAEEYLDPEDQQADQDNPRAYLPETNLLER